MFLHSNFLSSPLCDIRLVSHCNRYRMYHRSAGQTPARENSAGKAIKSPLIQSDGKRWRGGSVTSSRPRLAALAASYVSDTILLIIYLLDCFFTPYPRVFHWYDGDKQFDYRKPDRASKQQRNIRAFERSWVSKSLKLLNLWCYQSNQTRRRAILGQI